ITTERMNLMNSPKGDAKSPKVSFAMSLIAIGVVYGDIGTSPLYTIQTFVAGQKNGRLDYFSVCGFLSLIFWSIFLVVTLKYVILALRMDNHGEGGIFALFQLLKRKKAGWFLLAVAMIGGATFFADSVLTPAVSISSAVGGLTAIAAVRPFFTPTVILVITLIIIFILFAIQGLGTSSLGSVFGVLISVWFVFIAAFGALNMGQNWSILGALNPWLGIRFMFTTSNKAGLAILGTVFLATTGGEAIYSDMGHVGRGNIYSTWPFVNLALVLCYFGQGAWVLNHPSAARSVNPFFGMMPGSAFKWVAVILSVVAGIIASQALISGAFSSISTAARINWMPRLRLRYPSSTMGQIYIPAANATLCLATECTLLIFRTSAHLASAYGLALTITMLMNTLLMGVWMWRKRQKAWAVIFTVAFTVVQGMFFISSCSKFLSGGWYTALISLLLLTMMASWAEGTRVERGDNLKEKNDGIKISRLYVYPSLFLPAIDRLHSDTSQPYWADNVVYLTSDEKGNRIERGIYDSIFFPPVKHAGAYFIVSVRTTHDPYRQAYRVDSYGTNYFFRVFLELGFKENPDVPRYLDKIRKDLIASGELAPQYHSWTLGEDSGLGTTRYVLIKKKFSPSSSLPVLSTVALRIKYSLRRVMGDPAYWFGLGSYNPIIEYRTIYRQEEDLTGLVRDFDFPRGYKTNTIQKINSERLQPIKPKREAKSKAYDAGSAGQEESAK
ncbi:MAG: KUP/HAK/KT family potassium transporter, partial [Aeriscardovia sp.]|nr:KUP/HAK/KT family potassium transporter [Aeriscardovia sp.]